MERYREQFEKETGCKRVALYRFPVEYVRRHRDDEWHIREGEYYSLYAEWLESQLSEKEEEIKRNIALHLMYQVYE